MAKYFHASIGRRSESALVAEVGDAVMDPNEASLLDEFFNDDSNARQPLHHDADHGSSPERRPTPAANNNGALVEEFYDLSPDHANSNANAFVRRRRVDVDDSDESHPSRNNAPRNGLKNNVGYSSVDNNEARNAVNHDHGYDHNDISSSSKSQSQHTNLTWNKLNATLFVGQALLSAATSAPITLVPTMAVSLVGGNDNDEWNYAPYYNLETLEVYDETGTKKRWIPFRIRTKRSKNNNNNQGSSSIFASHLTSVVTLVTAFGKFINGALVDVAGARRLLLLYGMCTCLSLIGLRYSTTPNWAIGFCASVEFFSSINWSAGIVILGAHYGGTTNDNYDDGHSGSNKNGRFERGLYVTSLASRCGSLLAIPLSSLLIKWTDISWRGVAGLSACAAAGAVVVFYFYLTDSPGKVHDPQNPIRTIPQSRTANDTAHHPYHPSFQSWTPTQPALPRRAFNLCSSAFYTVLPSIRAILVSRVFWAVAAAHAGATMVKSSERILGTYFRDTSSGMVTESKAGAMTVFLSLGMLGGLLVGGKAFARAADSELGKQTRPNNAELDLQGQSLLIHAAQVGTKNMIAFFYCLSICMCYMLSFLAMPFVRKALHLPVLVLILQVLASLGLGFGVAVQYYHIPAIVGATYGKNRGLYTAYTDGVAALLSSIVWRIVGGAVEEGNPQGGGWSYGWAAVALLLVVCGTLMVKIVELYFVGGGWRHDTHKDHGQRTFPTELPPADCNSSWMEDEIRSTGFSIDASPFRPPRSLKILPSSALQYMGSPGRGQNRRTLAIVDSRDESDIGGNISATNLLGIDDDGSLLFPSSKIGPQQMRAHEELFSFNSILESKEILDSGSSCLRESSVFDDPLNDSFEL